MSHADVVGVNDEKFCIAGEAELFRKRLAVHLRMRFEESTRKKKEEQDEDDGLGSGSIEMDALESSERAHWSAFDAGMCKIKLHNFVAWYGTGVRHANGDCDGGLRGDLCLAYFRVGIIE